MHRVKTLQFHCSGNNRIPNQNEAFYATVSFLTLLTCIVFSLSASTSDDPRILTPEEVEIYKGFLSVTKAQLGNALLANRLTESPIRR